MQLETQVQNGALSSNLNPQVQNRIIKFTKFEPQDQNGNATPEKANPSLMLELKKEQRIHLPSSYFSKNARYLLNLFFWRTEPEPVRQKK